MTGTILASLLHKYFVCKAAANEITGIRPRSSACVSNQDCSTHLSTQMIW